MHHPTVRTAHTTAFITPVMEQWLERDIALWVHLERSNQKTTAPRVDALPWFLYMHHPPR